MGKTNFTVDKENLQVMAGRIFDAPKEAVWKACTDPKLLTQWWGPRNMTMTVDKMEFRVGGEWRFIHKDPAGNEYGFHGVYKVIEPMDKVIDTFNFEGIPAGHELVETLTLEEVEGGKTKMTTTAQYANIQDLEGMINSGMEKGQTESIDRLAELVEKK